MQTKIFVSASTNPWFNLAFEEYLVGGVKEDEVYFYLWQNAHTVVIGKHQNPWREVLVNALETDGGKVARRLSGGGAVYHDLGNLNFTFVMHKKHEDLHKQLKVIVDAVNALGIEAEFSGRNDILAKERKFSGNAFYYGKETYYHHGTVLVDVDMSRLGKYLNVSLKKLNAKGVQSVKSRVINLKELRPDLTIEMMKEALMLSFQETYAEAGSVYKITEKDAPPKAIERYEHYASWDWRFGKTPSFDAIFEEKFDWGELSIQFKLKDAVVEDVQIFSDAMDTEIVDLLEPVFNNVKFEAQALSEAVAPLMQHEPYQNAFESIKNWLLTLPL